jgi:DNA-binding NarL/FixJ family response regulator
MTSGATTVGNFLTTRPIQFNGGPCYKEVQAASSSARRLFAADCIKARITMPITRIVVADDHPIVLAGIKALINSASDLQIVGVAVDGIAALETIAEVRPDVAVVDISMPQLNGIKLAARLTMDYPQVKILVLTVHEDRAYVQQLLQAGVRGYLLKRSAADDLVRAIRAVAAGGIYVDPAVAEKMLRIETERSALSGQLSERESEVLRMTARGLSNKEVAGRLAISIKTVETYKARAAEKLGLQSRAEITRYGAAQGWMEEA